MLKYPNLKSTKCPKCDYLCDTSQGTKESEKPSAGDLSICMKCGQITQFDDNLQFIKPTNAFMLSLADEEPDFYLSLLKIQNEVKKANVLNYHK